MMTFSDVYKAFHMMREIPKGVVERKGERELVQETKGRTQAHPEASSCTAYQPFFKP